MTFHSLLLLLSFFFILCLAWLWHLDWSQHGLPHLAAKTAQPLVHRLLKPRSPRDCPACRLSSPLSAVVEPTSLPVRPWCEIKSRRGAPKRMNTQGFACPNRKCPYFAITDAHIHASFWGWHAWPCRADPDVSLSGLPYHVHFQAQLVLTRESEQGKLEGVGTAIGYGG
jgi:hypothetical protein